MSMQLFPTLIGLVLLLFFSGCCLAGSRLYPL